MPCLLLGCSLHSGQFFFSSSNVKYVTQPRLSILLTLSYSQCRVTAKNSNASLVLHHIIIFPRSAMSASAYQKHNQFYGINELAKCYLGLHYLPNKTLYNCCTNLQAASVITPDSFTCIDTALIYPQHLTSAWEASKLLHRCKLFLALSHTIGKVCSDGICHNQSLCTFLV